jgi:hypothetical protein
MSTTTVTVRRRMRSAPSDLFATLTDPLLFATVRGVRGVEVLQAGPGGPVSVGTLRRVNFPGGHLVEEIVGLEAPARFDYRIRDASVPFDHRAGRIEFLDRGDHVEAVWSSTFAFGIPVVGPLVAASAGIATRGAFRAVLREIDRATVLRTGEA